MIGGPGIATVPATQYQYWDIKTEKPITADEKIDELLTKLMERENDLWYILSLLCALVPASNSNLRAALAPLFQTGRKIIRDCPEVENGKEPFDLRSPEVDEKVINPLLGIAVSYPGPAKNLTALAAKRVLRSFRRHSGAFRAPLRVAVDAIIPEYTLLLSTC